MAGQPNGAASWFPCDDHPSSKASYRIQISTDSPYYALANGELVSRKARAGHTVWTYEQAEPTSSYLITLQIGQYESQRLAKTPVPMHAVLPARLKRNFDHDFERQPQMMKLFIKLFGPYPLASGYTVVVTDDDLGYRWRLRASRSSGPITATDTAAPNGSSLTNWPTSGSVTPSRHGAGATSGCTRASPATPNGCGPSTAAVAPPPNGPSTTTNGCATSPRTFCCPIPVPRTCSTTGCTSAGP